MIYAVILIGLTIAASWYISKVIIYVEKEQQEGESPTDNETPDFTRSSGEGLENIKKYGIWF